MNDIVVKCITRKVTRQIKFSFVYFIDIRSSFYKFAGSHSVSLCWYNTVRSLRRIVAAVTIQWQRPPIDQRSLERRARSNYLASKRFCAAQIFDFKSYRNQPRYSSMKPTLRPTMLTSTLYHNENQRRNMTNPENNCKLSKAFWRPLMSLINKQPKYWPIGRVVTRSSLQRKV